MISLLTARAKVGLFVNFRTVILFDSFFCRNNLSMVKFEKKPPPILSRIP